MVAAAALPSVAERERDLCVRAKAGDRAALADLLAMHDAFLWKLARRSRVPDKDDAHQEARIAAIEALTEYDPSRGYRFLTYASKWIVWRLRNVARDGGVIRTPSVDTGNPRSMANLRRAREIRSLDVPMNHDRGETPATLIPDRTSVLGSVISAEDEARVRDAVARIPVREREVLNRRLSGETLDAVGAVLGCTKEWVRQLEMRAVESVRTAMVGRSIAV